MVAQGESDRWSLRKSSTQDPCNLQMDAAASARLTGKQGKK